MRSWMIPFLIGLAACGQPRAEDAVAESGRKPGDVVDSILPMEEYERRFREGVAPADSLTGGAADIETLTRRVLAAIAARDTAGLAALAITRAEFAYLVYPSHIYRAAPYELDPGLFWLQIQQGSSKGAGQLLNHYGGRRLTLREVSCSVDTLQLQGASDIRMWAPCEVQMEVDDSAVTGRLFGTIVELDGHMKLMGYANDL